MRLLITHLTRMAGHVICVAGLTSEGEHIRPLPDRGPLTDDMVPDLFELGAVVELGDVTDVGEHPEVEDRQFRRDEAHKVKMLPLNEAAHHVARVASVSLAGALGTRLVATSSGALSYVEGTGPRSLGVVEIPAGWTMHVQGGRVRLRWHDLGYPAVNAPVTDLRVRHVGFVRDLEPIRALWRALEAHDRVFACVGLTRPWDREDGAAPHHWLMVNTLWGYTTKRSATGDPP